MFADTNEKRIELVVTNTDSGGEVARISDKEGQAATSADIIYNKETLRITGELAAKAWYGISDTAATTISYTERFKK